MIVGTGLIARALLRYEELLDGVFIHAAGVSNSSCNDETEYARDRLRLLNSVAIADPAAPFIYISTCSVDDPASQTSRYVRHKRELEQIAQQHRAGSSVIVRLPQVAGATPNPHTILNFLYARIARSERFDLWRQATRNVIDADDVGRILTDMVVNERIRSGILNIANPLNSSVLEIVSEFEKITNRRAVCTTLNKGADHIIDSTRIRASILRCGIVFDDGYLQRTLKKYYS